MLDKHLTFLTSGHFCYYFVIQVTVAKYNVSTFNSDLPIHVFLGWNWRSCKDIAKESNEWSVPGFVLTVIYKLLLNLLFLTMRRLLSHLLFSFFLWYFITSPFPIYPHPLIFNFFYKEKLKKGSRKEYRNCCL